MSERKFEVIWKPKAGLGVVRFRSEVTADGIREATEKVCLGHRVAGLVSVTEVDQNPIDSDAKAALFHILESNAVRDGWRSRGD